MLRITSGEYRNRRILVPDTGEIRPMLDKPRQALFSILGQDIALDCPVLDCFAGSGVLGFECLSRGASHAYFFDLNPKHIEAIKSLADTLKCSTQCVTQQGDVTKTLSPNRWSTFQFPEPFKLIFLDPPHALVDGQRDTFFEWFKELAEAPFVDNDTLIIYGHHARQDPDQDVGEWKRFDRRKYGKVALSIYAKTAR